MCVCVCMCPSPPDVPDLSKYSLKQLRTELKVRDVACVGCTDKSDLVDMLTEHWDVEKDPDAVLSTPDEEDVKEKDQKNVERLMEQLGRVELDKGNAGKMRGMAEQVRNTLVHGRLALVFFLLPVLCSSEQSRLT